MKRHEPSRIIHSIEPGHVQHVPSLSVVQLVAEAELLAQGVRRQEAQLLVVRVELRDHGEAHFAVATYDISHGDVIWIPQFIAYADEPATTARE